MHPANPDMATHIVPIMPDAKGHRGLWEALESILRERGELENLERLRELFTDETRKW